MKKLLFIWMLGAGCALQQVHADAYHVIICGSGGEEEFVEKFQSWGERLEGALIETVDVPSSNVYLLTEGVMTETPPMAVSTIDSIRSVFEIVANQAGEDDSVFIYLIGHGSFYKSISRVHIPGIDMTVTDFASYIDSLSVKELVIVNGTSTSAAYINELSGPGRIICSATKSVTEFNATEFMAHFVEGLEDGSADRNRDERITIYEACQQAAELTDAWYISSGYIPTEHAILDDNGDGQGTRLTWDMTAGFDPSVKEAAGQDGAFAKSVFLKNYVFPEGVSQEWIDQYMDAMDAVDALKQQKLDLEEEAYFERLESLFLDAARANAKIRSFQPEEGSDT
ncbi:MAG: hypothetical protein VCD00_21095 [Candidatus Hydrogenedentota bacterium]